MLRRAQHDMSEDHYTGMEASSPYFTAIFLKKRKASRDRNSQWLGVGAEGLAERRSAPSPYFVSNPRPPACKKAYVHFYLTDIILLKI